MPHVNHFLSLPSDLYAEFSEIARLRGMSMSDFMLESLIKNADAYLQPEGKHAAVPTLGQPKYSPRWI